MPKKKKAFRPTPPHTPQQLNRDLDKVESLVSNHKLPEARDLLEKLDKKFPEHLDVLALMTGVYLDLEDWDGFLQAVYRFHKQVPDRADVKLNLASACYKNHRYALALRTYRQFLERWPDDEQFPEVENTVRVLETSLATLMGRLGLSLETDLDFACRHDELQILMEMEEYERARKMAIELLEQRPDFVPALNNLSQIYWLEDDLLSAISTSLKGLDIQPDNIHALSNLTRYAYMQGRKEDALAFAHRLKESKADAADRWFKIAHALIFIGDDQGVVDLLAQAKQARESGQLTVSFWHWYAAANYRLGNLAEARSAWRKCLDLSPDFSLAADNLAELKKPIHERICPQIFSAKGWLPERTIINLVTAIDQVTQNKGKKEFLEKRDKYLSDHPEILQFISASLSAGNSDTRDFVLKLADKTSYPAILEILKDFALGQEGPDGIRTRAAHILTEHGVLERGQAIDLWQQGKWVPSLMLEFQITDQPINKDRLVPAAQRLMEQAVMALDKQDGSAAEGFLRKAVKIQPKVPALINNLALALNLQGKDAEAAAIIDQMTEQFPDYLFAQYASAKNAILAGDLEKAKNLLRRMMKKEVFHVSEFSAICSAQFELLVASEEYRGAMTWVQLWRKGYPNDPVLREYETKIGMIGLLIKTEERIARLSKKSSPTTE